MNVLAILRDFTLRCKSVFENTTAKMSKRFLNWLILTIRTVALIPGKVNFTRLSRYGGRTAKTFAVNFGSHEDWLGVNGRLALEEFQGTEDVALPLIRHLSPSQADSHMEWANSGRESRNVSSAVSR